MKNDRLSAAFLMLSTTLYLLAGLQMLFAPRDLIMDLWWNPNNEALISFARFRGALLIPMGIITGFAIREPNTKLLKGVFLANVAAQIIMGYLTFHEISSGLIHAPDVLFGYTVVVTAWTRFAIHLALALWAAILLARLNLKMDSSGDRA